MKKYIYIGSFGFLGALLRFIIKNVNISVYKGNIPINTLFINVSGCFLLALVSGLILNSFEMHKDLKLAITTGFIGTYTTFSSLCKEMVNLMSTGKYFSAAEYVSISVILGFIAVIMGSAAAKAINIKIQDNINEEKEDVI